MLRRIGGGAFDASQKQVRETPASGASLGYEGSSVFPHPNDPERVLRRVEPGGIGLKPAAYIDLARQHWDNLPVDRPDAVFATYRSFPWIWPRICASVQKIEGQGGQELLLKQDRTPEETLALQGFARAIDHYYTWVLTTQQPFVMRDLSAGARQAMYGTLAGTTGEPRIFHTDLDPYLAPMPAEPLTPNSQWNKGLSGFAAWAELVDVTPQTPYVPPVYTSTYDL